MNSIARDRAPTLLTILVAAVAALQLGGAVAADSMKY